MREMANWEHEVVVRELQKLVGGRLTKFYELAPLLFRMRIHIPGTDVDVIAQPPVRLHETKYIREAPETPTNFAMKIRKHCEGAKIDAVEQHGFDRVVVFVFSDGIRLVFELFGKGNVVLVSEEGKTIDCYRKEEWKDRVLQPGKEYSFPSSNRINPRSVNAEQISVKASEKQVMTMLTGSIDLGATYIEEAVLRAGLEPKSKSSGLSKNEVGKLVRAFEFLSNPEPVVYVKDGQPVEYGLTEFVKYAGFEKERMPTLNEALDRFYSVPPIEEKASPMDKQRAKLLHRKEEQTKKLEEMLSIASEKKRAGDLIYENYEKVESLLTLVKEARERKETWEKIEAALEKKGARVDRKTGFMEIEI